MSTDHDIWVPGARRRASLLASDVTDDPLWRRAFTETPRDHFAGTIYDDTGETGWRALQPGRRDYLPAVYRDTELVTRVSDPLACPAEEQQIRVSCPAPSVQARLLAALQVHDGQRVLHIGTGTGYAAALLCHRLGPDCVVALDVADVQHQATLRLSRAGYHPLLAVGELAAGCPKQGLFDRIFAPWAVPAIPHMWRAQLKQGGLLLTELRRGPGPGRPVLLRRHDTNTLSGRFLPFPGGCRALSPAHQPVPTDTTSAADLAAAVSRTVLDPQPEATGAGRVPWLLAEHYMGPGFRFSARRSDRDDVVYVISDDTGSWARVPAAPGPRGDRPVLQGGPHHLWDAVTAAAEAWAHAGSPGWERYGLTITAQGRHSVWLDHPDTSPYDLA